MRTLTLTAAAVAAIALGGCVSLFPKSEPSQLYRFGASPPGEPAGPGANAAPIGLVPLEFVEAAGSDRILTVTGNEVAYVAGARWATPAKIMFGEAMTRAFERSARNVSLVGRRELRSTSVLLDVDVNSFEARYENGREAAPTVVVSLDARLVRFPERTVLDHKVIEVRRPAGENRMSAIVAAIDAATNDALGQLVAWTDATAPRT
ncbi:MAG TPA: ABC-type transport auxiliary lipoprotein family protein [Caulobacteraceae bacterium]|nr:ABC-type transport auxiliary lipoprotein family protein [Caulobacteraceae bacterium]